MVFLSIIPDIIITAIAIKNIAGATIVESLNTAAAKRAMIGILAPHGMKVDVIMVILLSFSFSIVLVAITPGIPQPVEISIGMKLFPERPNFLNILSITNATLAM